jgi:HD-GYP domain-containing protein (c-di-GMP phosphodiesterase class II)
VPLTGRLVERIADRGFARIWVADQGASGIPDDDPVSQYLRRSALDYVNRLLDTVARAGRDVPSTAGRELDRLCGLVESVIDDVSHLAHEAMIRLRAHDDYTFCHSVNVAMTAVFIGQRFFLDRSALRHLALGCILHDVGKSLIDPELLNKPDAYSEAERAMIQRHPALGYEMLRLAQPAEFLANHVVYQHHERQDGTGYPRGLTGTNRVRRDPSGTRPRMMFIAEIAAVADVFDALSSDRPHRRAYPRDRVVLELNRMAGPHLNREIVQRFLSWLPAFAPGMPIVVTEGRFKGYRGVVVAPGRAADRPVVQIGHDAAGRAIAPFQLDLARYGSAKVAATFAD